MPLFPPVGIPPSTAPQENWGSWNQRLNGDLEKSTGLIEGSGAGSHPGQQSLSQLPPPDASTPYQQTGAPSFPYQGTPVLRSDHQWPQQMAPSQNLLAVPQLGPMASQLPAYAHFNQPWVSHSMPVFAPAPTPNQTGRLQFSVSKGSEPAMGAASGPSPSPHPPKAGGAPVLKNAVTLLNEFCQKCKLDAPSYFFFENAATKTHAATVTVRGQSFIGRGSKKTTAKNAAAEKALTQMQGLGAGALALKSTPDPTPRVVPLAAGSLPKDSVSILNELCQKRKLLAVYTFAHDSSFQDPKAVPLHITKLAVAGLIFVAKAPRKDAAKKAAAKAALEHFEGPVGKSVEESTPAQRAPARLTGPSVTPQEIAALAQLLPGFKAEPQPSSGEKTSISSSAVDIPPQDQNNALDASTPPPQPAQGAQPSSPGPVDASPGMTGDGGEEGGSLRRPLTTGAPKSGKRDYASLAATGKDPVSLLNEFTMRQGTHLEIEVRKLQAAMPAFVAECVLQGRTFSVEGASKAAAKKGVADMVLQHLEREQPGTLESLKGRSAKKARYSEKEGEGSEGAETDRGVGPRSLRKRKGDDVERRGSNPFADRLAGLACSKYRELTAGDTGQKGKQVLAAFVLEVPTPTGDPLLSLVALATGTHSGRALSKDVHLLGDCRAEVLARRALRRFLCSKLESELLGTPLEGALSEGVATADKQATQVAEEAPAEERASGQSAGVGPETGDAAGTTTPEEEGPNTGSTEGQRGEGIGGEVADRKRAKTGELEAESNNVLADGRQGAAALGPGSVVPAQGTPSTEAPVSGGESTAGEACSGAEQGGQSLEPREGSPRTDEPVFCRVEGARKWRLRPDVKLHLWVSSPVLKPWHQARGSLEERESRKHKMERWTVLGLQGAVLSHLLEPVYLASVTVNADADLYREAIKLEGVAEQLPKPFAVSQPSVSQAYCFTGSTFRNTSKDLTTTTVGNWALGSGGWERVDVWNGRIDSLEGGESRLSTQQMFEQFRELERALTANGAPEGLDVQEGSVHGPRSFEDVKAAKDAAVIYREAKEVLIRFLADRVEREL